MNDKVFWALETLLVSINTNSLIYNFNSCKCFYSYSANEKDCYKLWYNDYSNRVYLGVCKKSKGKRNNSFDFYDSSSDGKVISEVASFSSVNLYDEESKMMLASYLLNKLVELGYLYHDESCSDKWFYTLQDMYHNNKSPIINGVVKDKSYLLSHVIELINVILPSNEFFIIPKVDGNELYNSLICIDSDLVCHFKESNKKLENLKEYELGLILSMLEDNKRYCVDEDIDISFSQQKHLSKKYGTSKPNVFSYDDLVLGSELFKSILYPIFDSNEFKDKYLLPYGWYDFNIGLFHPQIEISEDGVKIYVILRNEMSSSYILSYMNSYFCMNYSFIFKFGELFLSTEEVPYLYLYFTDEIKERLSELKFDEENSYLFPIKVKR